MDKRIIGLKNIQKRVAAFGSAIGKNSWVFTVLFFLISLMAGVYIWWNNVYNPQPTFTTQNKINNNQEDFNILSQSIERVIKQIQERENKYNQKPDYSGLRDVFHKESAEENVEAAGVVVKAPVIPPSVTLYAAPIDQASQASGSPEQL
jgi:cytoskeletal protein RodZ